tara:strand:- start:89 stop:1744 length:1656 start_codon:yes stop_codon:yes gene_type:complete
MSLNTLLESANPYHSVQSDAARLANKWEKTGLLEGMSGANKSNMGIILENQAKQLVVESSNTGGGAGSGTFTAGTGAQWAGVALPLVRKVFGQIAAKEFVSVQPMNLPSGLVFYLDFQYGTDKAPFGAGESLYGNTGTNPSTLPFGNTNTGGLYGAGRYGYSINLTSSVLANAALSSGSATMTDICWDSSLSSSVALGPQAVGGLALLTVLTSSINANFDQEALKSFYLIGGNAPAIANQYPQFTKFASNGADLEFVVPSNSVIPGTDSALSYSLAPLDNERGDFEDGNNNLNGQNTPIKIPEINVQMQSSAIVAKTRKLKAVWTPEFAQDLNAYHALDAEAELTSILSEYISLEIDLEILDMLVESAAAGTEVWSAVNNRSISGTGNGTVSSLGFYNSQGQWFQTLGTKIQKLSNIIHQKTLRGGANFMVISPTIGTILESIPGYAADADGDVSAATYAFGVQKVGAFNGRYKVYKNPYMTDNCMLLGFRGAQFLETGAVFAPYIPLIMTPLVYDPETFTPRKGLMTRYAKKMVRPEFYGKIMINGLETL